MNDKKYVLITGVSTGIGYELSKQLILNGYSVFGSIRKKEEAERLEKNFGENFIPLIFDITHDDAIEHSFEKVKSITGESGLVALINNAGIAIGGPLLEVPIEQIRLQFEVNVIGLIKVTQVFAPLLKSTKARKSAGRILMISSVAGEIGMPFIGPYAGSKHALEGISKSLRRELQLLGIKVIVIGPGAIKTPIWDKSLEPVAANYQQSEFSESISVFAKKFVSKAAAGGLDVTVFVKKIIKILHAENPKNRYVMVSFWLTNWFIPRYIPEKWLDLLLKKLLKLHPKRD